MQRQHGERPGGQEMLLGAALVVALVADGGDDRRIAAVDQPVVAMSASPRSFERAPSAATTRRARISRRRPASAPRRTARRQSSPRRRRSCSTPVANAAARNAAVTSSLKRHIGERLAAGIGEAQLLEPHGVSRRAVVDRHFDGSAASAAASASQAPSAVQQRARAGAQRDGAQPPVAAAGRSVNQRDFQPHARFALQRGGEGEPDGAGADDRDVENGFSFIRASCGGDALRHKRAPSRVCRLAPPAQPVSACGSGASPSRDGAEKDTRSGGKHG